MAGPPDCVLVLRFSAVGDVLLTAPALAALKAAWPATRVLFAVKAPLAPLVAHNPCVDEVLPLEQGAGPWDIVRRARAAGVGAVLDLHGKMRSKLIRLLLPGVRAVCWHQRELSDTVAVKLRVRPYSASMLHAERYHRAVEQLVGSPLPPQELRYWPSPEGQKAAREALVRAGVEEGRPLLGLSPGANWQTKRWPAERFGALAARALSRGWQVAMAGSSSEQELGQAVRAQAPGVADLCGALDLAGLGGFVERCDAFVSNDSGPMHLSRALGVPTLGLFGSTDPKMFSWQGHAAAFVEGIPCAPCSFFGRRRCPEGHFRCMTDLSVDQAWAALEPLLDRRRRPPVSG